jgi:hypothetical protein
MTHYAVLIGNSQFLPQAGLSSLASPPKDVEGLAVELQAEGRGLFDQVIPLINQNHANIAKELIRVLNKAGKHDLVLFYYSGHGKTKSNDLFLATADTEDDELLEVTALSFDLLYKWIAKSHCKKVVIILDCCYSGIAGQVFKGDLNSQLASINANAKGTFLMTATSNDQVALDQAEGGYSLFTKYLISGLRGEADRDAGGSITPSELFRYVREKVIADKPDQVPKHFGSDEGRDELILAKSGRDNRKERAEKLRIFLLERASKDKAMSQTSIEPDLLSE